MGGWGGIKCEGAIEVLPQRKGGWVGGGGGELSHAEGGGGGRTSFEVP